MVEVLGGEPQVLREAPDGTLWVGTTGGVARVRANTATTAAAALAALEPRPLPGCTSLYSVSSTPHSGARARSSDAAAAPETLRSASIGSPSAP